MDEDRQALARRTRETVGDSTAYRIALQRSGEPITFDVGDIVKVSPRNGEAYIARVSILRPAWEADRLAKTFYPFWVTDVTTKYLSVIDVTSTVQLLDRDR